VAKVKKAGAVRRARSGKDGGGKNAPSGALTSATRKPVRGMKAKGAATLKAKTPVARFRVTPLDPQKKCGTGTSVQRLFRISEESAAGLRSHLVFLDRHGWYCEHGRECPAVRHAQKFR
jgi:hypothetical protein